MELHQAVSRVTCSDSLLCFSISCCNPSSWDMQGQAVRLDGPKH